MRKRKFAFLPFLAGIALLVGTTDRGLAYSNYGTDVDNSAACATASPKPYSGGGNNCGLCHQADRGAATPQKSAYVAANFGFFCPTASAGPTQTVPEGTAVSLNGTNSTGTIDAYAWTQAAGSAVSLTDASTATAGFTAPSVGVGGEALVFQLTVSRTPGYSTTTTVTSSASTNVNVTDVAVVNQPPVANAGPTQTVASGAPVILDGSNSSDPDGTVASYAWVQTAGPAVALSDAAAPMPTFLAPAAGATDISMTFQLTVTDNGGATGTATTVVNVAAADNTAPTANAGQDQTVAEGALVTLDGSGSSDANGMIASYLWSQTGGPAVTLSNAAAAQPTFSAPAVGDPGAALTFLLTVTDNGGLSATDTTIVNVSNVYLPPIANAGAHQTVAPGAAVTLDGSKSSAPDGTIVSYLWAQTAGPSVTLSDPAAVKPTFTAPTAAGPLTFKLTVTDDAGLSASSSVTVTVTGQGSSKRKSVRLAPDFAGPQAPGAVVTFIATPGGPAVPYEYRFSLHQPARRWAVVQSYSPNTSWTWDTQGLRAGTYQVRVDMRAVGSPKDHEATKTIRYLLRAPRSHGHQDDDDDDDDDERRGNGHRD